MQLTPDIVGAVAAACQNGAAEAGAALSRTLGQEVRLSVGQSGAAESILASEGLAGPGLLIVLKVDNASAVLLVPESPGLFPPWFANPDATGKSKLATLAQELGMLLLPDDVPAEEFTAGYVRNLNEAVRRGHWAPDAAAVPLELGYGEGRQGTAYLVWPTGIETQVVERCSEQAMAGPTPVASSTTSTAKPPRPSSIKDLPLYTRSLLRIRVPVVVTLAEKRQRLDRILELGPGSIIQFDKSCEEMLDLEVGGRRLARGEAVKVGDKFGLRINSMVLPEERFKPVRKDNGGTRKGD